MIMKDDFLLSIIIPHYNTPDLLGRLLSSIPNNKEIQTIVVDDASSKNVKNQLLEMQKQYEEENFIFLDNNSPEHNAGLARNIGIKHADGKWILFADSDDYFEDGFYECVKEYFKTDYDIVFFQPASVDSATGETASRNLPYVRRIQNYLDNPCLDAECELRYSWFPPWSKLIRRSIILEHEILFESVKHANDIMFSVKAGYYAKKITVSSKTIYCVTKREASLTENKDVKVFDIRAHEKIKAFTFLKSHLTKKELHGLSIYKFALEDLSTIISRRYGLSCFIKYFKLFMKNGMIIPDARVFSPVKFFHRLTRSPRKKENH